MLESNTPPSWATVRWLVAADTSVIMSKFSSKICVITQLSPSDLIVTSDKGSDIISIPFKSAKFLATVWVKIEPAPSFVNSVLTPGTGLPISEAPVKLLATILPSLNPLYIWFSLFSPLSKNDCICFISAPTFPVMFNTLATLSVAIFIVLSYPSISFWVKFLPVILSYWASLAAVTKVLWYSICLSHMSWGIFLSWSCSPNFTTSEFIFNSIEFLVLWLNSSIFSAFFAAFSLMS